jgi:hypothetical protein
LASNCAILRFVSVDDYSLNLVAAPAGIHIALAAINLIPIGGTIVLFWVIAFSKWPKLQVITSDRAVERKVKERLSGTPMPDPAPAPMTDEMIKQIAERFGADARPEDTATLDAKQLRFMKPFAGPAFI